MSSSRPSADEPIDSSRHDQLGRASIAFALARELRSLDVSRGLVAGIMGPWGEGKSSFVNLMREQFAEDPALIVVDFNPWMLSGSGNLTDVFFSEIAAELRVKSQGAGFEKVADELDSYGAVLAPIASTVVPFWGALAVGSGRLVTKGLKHLLSLRKKGVRQLHERVADALKALADPVVVVIDDIDRLETQEIRDIFRLVRVTAHFPNLLYVLAFDRGRVEAALGDGSVAGRSYLEKIVQIGFDLPSVRDDVLSSNILDVLNGILGSSGNSRFDEKRWPDVFYEVIRPLFTSLRDVKRYAISTSATVSAMEADIELVDLFALEAVRIFRPEVFALLRPNAALLTGVGGYGSAPDPKQKEVAEAFISLDAVAGAMVRHLFPAARRFLDNTSYGAGSQREWRKQHRVAHEDWLSLYLSKSVPDALSAFTAAELLSRVIADGTDVNEYFDAIPTVIVEDTVDAMVGFADDVAEPTILPLMTTLLNRVEAIPTRPRRSMFDFNRPDILVSRVVLQLLERLAEGPSREEAVGQVFERLETYSAKLELIRIVGHEEGSGHKLVPEAFAEDLKVRFVDAVLEREPPFPQREWNAIRVYFVASEAREAPVLTGEVSPDLVRALLSTAKTERVSQSMGSRNIESEDVLVWDVLVQISGSEKKLGDWVDLLRSADGDTALVALAQKYIEGWRPREWMGRD